MADNDDLLDYEEEEATDQTVVADSGTDGPAKKEVKGTYVSIHSSGFRDFLLKPEILRAIIDCGFEHPSEVQHECIPQAVLGIDILCQAKSGMGKTAVFVLASLQQLEPVDGQVSVLVMCHTRELAFQISKEYERFSKYMPTVKVGVFFGGMPLETNVQQLKSNCPHIVVGTPGRILALIRNKKLTLKNVKQFILDECDKMLEQLDMRKDVQEIFRNTPHEKQVMMFSATLSKEIRPVCKKFMQDVITQKFALKQYCYYCSSTPTFPGQEVVRSETSRSGPSVSSSPAPYLLLTNLLLESLLSQVCGRIIFLATAIGINRDFYAVENRLIRR